MTSGEQGEIVAWRKTGDLAWTVARLLFRAVKGACDTQLQ
jgi:hypothetical protein